VIAFLFADGMQL